jgi:L-amino acid N-acyltransferase YncA
MVDRLVRSESIYNTTSILKEQTLGVFREYIMEFMIRDVRIEDAQAIVNIFNPIIKTERLTVLDKPLTVEMEREFIRSFPERGIFHVAEGNIDNKILGFQVVEPFGTYSHMFDHVAIIGTYVNLSLRGKGIGKRLSKAAFRAAKNKGFEKFFTYIRAGNQEALAFYHHLGFRIVGTARRQVKCKDKYEDEVIVEKFLV